MLLGLSKRKRVGGESARGENGWSFPGKSTRPFTMNSNSNERAQSPSELGAQASGKGVGQMGNGKTSIHVVDCQYEFPQFAASFIVESGGEVAIIEQNTSHAVPLILKRLEELGLNPEQVRYIIPTHIHLDHVGGAGTLLSHCKNAQVLCHPRALRHLVDPTKLVAAVREVYGSETFDRLYGRMDPIPEARISAVEEGQTQALGEETLEFWHTRGHANHHLAVHLPHAEALFTGDSFGLVYPALQDLGLFGVATTSPSDFDPQEALKTVQRIVQWGSAGAESHLPLESQNEGSGRRVFLTHFGEVKDVTALATQLKSDLQWSSQQVDRLEASLKAGEISPSDRVEQEAQLTKALLSRWIERYAHRQSLNKERRSRLTQLLKMDSELNAQGLWVAAQKRVGKNSSGH